MCECCGGDCKLTEVNMEKKDPTSNFSEEISDISDVLIKELDEAIEVGWNNVQSNNRPDQSFRAMLIVMKKWRCYMEAQKKYTKHKQNIDDTMNCIGIFPEKLFHNLIISRLQDIEKLLISLKRF